MKIDPAELIDANEFASILGLARREAISTYRNRYPDFPKPVVEKGQCVLWLRSEALAYKAKRVAAGRTRKTPSRSNS